MAQRHCHPDELLADAIERMSPKDVRAALEAGANPLLEWDGEDDEWAHYRWTPADRLVSHWFSDMRLTDATLEGRALACLRLLHERGGIRAAEASDLLVTAARHGCGPAMAQFFLDVGADVHYKSYLGFMALSEARWADTARVLIAAGADAREGSLLARAAAHSKHPLEYTRVLLKAGAKVNAASRGVGTPLCSALKNCAPTDLVAVVTLLLEAGADPLVTQATQTTTAWLMDIFTQRPVDAFKRDRMRERLPAWRAVAPLLACATAWRRRRHLVLAIRGRHGGVQVARFTDADSKVPATSDGAAATGAGTAAAL